jgi:hypothetical protein
MKAYRDQVARDDRRLEELKREIEEVTAHRARYAELIVRLEAKIHGDRAESAVEPSA